MRMRLLGIGVSLVVTFFAAGFSLAADKGFEMPANMVRLLPETADMVLAASSVLELEEIWLECNPDHPTWMPPVRDALMGFADLVDEQRPLLVVINLGSSPAADPFQLTLLLPLKDKNANLTRVQGYESFFIHREGDYVAATMDQRWQPSHSAPPWARNLKPGVLSVSLNLESIIESQRMVIEMGLASLETQVQAGRSAEQNQAMVKILRAFFASAQGLELALDHDQKYLREESVFQFKRGSPLYPGPQPSYDQALELTRFLPGGEDLLWVAALDHSAQLEYFSDYYVATLHQNLDHLDAQQAQMYIQWYLEYLGSLGVYFQPTAMTLKLEKGGSSTLAVLHCDQAGQDWDNLVSLIDGMKDLGTGMDFERIEVEPVAGQTLLGWSLTLDAARLGSLMADDNPLADQDPLMGAGLMALLRLAPRNIYLCRIDDLILVGSGPGPEKIGQLVRNIQQGRGQVDPRLKRAQKAMDSPLQFAATGNLGAFLVMTLEINEELDLHSPNQTWNLKKHPLPFLATMAINDGSYHWQVELEKSALRQFLMAWQQKQ